jgi:hypothetical protein
MPFVGRARHLSARLLGVLSFVLAAYVVVQSAAPVLEHDLVCHLKSRTHCTVCATGVFAPGMTEAAAQPPSRDLPRVAAIEAGGERAVAAPPTGTRQNRAPPA